MLITRRLSIQFSSNTHSNSISLECQLTSKPPRSSGIDSDMCWRRFRKLDPPRSRIFAAVSCTWSNELDTSQSLPLSLFFLLVYETKQQSSKLNGEIINDQ